MRTRHGQRNSMASAAMNSERPSATNDLVSVLIAVHNGESTVAVAIMSALDQTHTNVEVIVVDDGSTDNSWSVIRSLAAQDARVVPIRCLSASGGPAIPRNAALATSAGQFLALLDQDDRWMPTKLEKQLQLFADEEVGLVYSDCELSTGGSYLRQVVDHHGHLPKGDVTRQIVEFSFIPACTAVWTRTAFERIGGFAEDLSSVDDRDYWVRLAFAGFKVECVPDQLAVLNVSGNRLSADRVKHDALSVKLWSRHLAARPDDEVLQRKLQDSKHSLARSRVRLARTLPLAKRVSSWHSTLLESPTVDTAIAMARVAARDSRVRQGGLRRLQDLLSTARSALRPG